MTADNLKDILHKARSDISEMNEQAGVPLSPQKLMDEL